MWWRNVENCPKTDLVSRSDGSKSMILIDVRYEKLGSLPEIGMYKRRGAKPQSTIRTTPPPTKPATPATRIVQNVETKPSAAPDAQRKHFLRMHQLPHLQSHSRRAAFQHEKRCHEPVTQSQGGLSVRPSARRQPQDPTVITTQGRASRKTFCA